MRSCNSWALVRCARWPKCAQLPARRQPSSRLRAVVSRRHGWKRLHAMARSPREVPPEGRGVSSMRVALFVTCFNDTLFPQVGIATTELLERLGHTVVFPEAQTCCGQMHYNTGYQQEALTLVRHFVKVFGASDVEAIVAPSASCAGMVRDLYAKAAAQAGDARLAAQVEALVPRVYELGEFLVKRLGVVDVGAYLPHRVTYHAT